MHLKLFTFVAEFIEQYNVAAARRNWRPIGPTYLPDWNACPYCDTRDHQGRKYAQAYWRDVYEELRPLFEKYGIPKSFFMGECCWGLASLLEHAKIS